MIIDLIIDRMENEPLLALGHTHMVLGGIVETLYAGDEIKNGNTIIPLKYMPERFYQQVMDYGEVGFGITAAMDGGTEEDVKRELCKYIINNEYNPDLCNYINERTWL
jgi:hypothetical protein